MFEALLQTTKYSDKETGFGIFAAGEFTTTTLLRWWLLVLF